MTAAMIIFAVGILSLTINAFNYCVMRTKGQITFSEGMGMTALVIFAAAVAHYIGH